MKRSGDKTLGRLASSGRAELTLSAVPLTPGFFGPPPGFLSEPPTGARAGNAARASGPTEPSETFTGPIHVTRVAEDPHLHKSTGRLDMDRHYVLVCARMQRPRAESENRKSSRPRTRCCS
jgi:hypothetical protein